MRTSVTRIGLIILLAVGTVGLTGCDSGGGSEMTEETSSLEKTDGVMVNLKESESSSSAEKATVTGDLTVDFHYENDSKEDCTLSKRENDVSPGYNGSFAPSDINGECENVSDFDGVRAYYKADSDTSPLELEILTEDGSETIASVVSDNAGNGMEAFETVSSDVTIPDEIGGGLGGGDDGSGDDGTGGDGSIDSASELANTIRGTWRRASPTSDEITSKRFKFVYSSNIMSWYIVALGEEGCPVGQAGVFRIVSPSTLKFSPSSDYSYEASISYSDGVLTILNTEGEGERLTLKVADKNPSLDQCGVDINSNNS